ncbi:MAG: GNAT family N-acetyltransferase [Phycisphaerales bacterium]|nr:GNAT family N-acetyltransferase [Phycisphaerales bacterium]
MSDTAIRIRRATAADCGALAEVLAALGFDQLTALSQEQRQAQVARHMEALLGNEFSAVWVAEAQSSIVGYAAAHWIPVLGLAGPEGYVSELFVRADWRGRGAGTALLEVVERAARDHGCVRLSLLNLRARAAYRRGFYPQRGWVERDAANFVRRLEEAR